MVNAALGSTPLSSPLDSPDVLNTLVPLSDIGVASTSIGSIKIPSLDSINLRNQREQVRLLDSKHQHISGSESYENLQRLASALASASRCSTRMTQTTHNSCSSQTVSPARHCFTSGPGSAATNGTAGCDFRANSATSLRSLALNRRHFLTNPSANNSSTWLSLSGSSLNTNPTQGSGEHLQQSCKCLTAIPEALTESPMEVGAEKKTFFIQRCGNSEERVLLFDEQGRSCVSTANLCSQSASTSTLACNVQNKNSKMLEFSISSVGRSFIEESAGSNTMPRDSANASLTTPDSPTPNISPTSQPGNSDAFSNDFVPRQEKFKNSVDIPLAQFGGSWDLLELDLHLHEVNLDTCYDTDVEECVFMGDENLGREDDDDDDEMDICAVVDDPFGVLPTKPTPPDSLDL